MNTQKSKTRLITLMLCGACVISALSLHADSDDVGAGEKPMAHTYVIVHGAHDGAWAWRGVANKLQVDGHRVFTTTLTGSGERAHLATPEVGLDTHIQDVVNVLAYEKLNSIILVGHSYGGMVISGVAEKVPERIKQLVYLDAVVPEDGQSCVDIFGPEAMAYFEHIAKEHGDGWRLPHNPPDADRRTDALLKAFKQPLRIKNPDAAKLKHTYVRFNKNKTNDPTEIAFAKKLQQQGWQYLERPFNHFPVLKKPDEVAQMLIEIVD